MESAFAQETGDRDRCFMVDGYGTLRHGSAEFNSFYNAEKEALVPGHDPRIPPKLHRQTFSLCLHVVSDDLIHSQVEVRRERATQQHDKL